jgi:hypothetical protein
MTETTPETIACPNPVVDATRSIASAMGQDISCDKAKGFLLLVGIAIVGIVILKFFVLKK